MKKRPFPWSKKNFYARMAEAVSFYWEGRQTQARTQTGKGLQDAGTRGEVTGGHQLDAFGQILCDLACSAGFEKEAVFFAKPLPIPGYYRAQKKWDFAVFQNDRLIAAVELKSQSGSFGNNCNNRAEEVIGQAHDFWIAYREKAFGVVPAPWLGYLFLLEDSRKSRTPVKLFPSPLTHMQKFEQTSYLARYRLLCEALVLERDFAATSLLLSKRPAPAAKASFSEPFANLSFYAFCKTLYAHLTANVNE